MVTVSVEVVSTERVEQNNDDAARRTGVVATAAPHRRRPPESDGARLVRFQAEGELDVGAGEGIEIDRDWLPAMRHRNRVLEQYIVVESDAEGDRAVFDGAHREVEHRS